MKLIVGLGNPGAKFKNTRHNLGFMVVDAFAKSHALSWRYSQDWMGFYVKTGDFVLLKPSTFMNKSGESIRPAAAFYKVGSGDILVIHDDLDLPFGKVRVSIDGSSAGHHGVESTIVSLGGMDFARLRIGINHPSLDDPAGKQAVENYVLSEFNDEQKVQLTKLIIKCQEAVDSFIAGGVDSTKNVFS